MPATAEETRRYMLVYYVALSSIFWFDWFVTLHKEYRKIWKSKWNAVKIVYLVNRYTMLALTVFILQGFNMDWNTSRCNKYLLGWQNALPLIVQTAIGFMLMLRCYAIWANSKRVLWFLMVLHAAHMGVSCWLSIADVKTMVFPEGNGPCIPYNTRPNLMLGCIFALIYDLAATGLTLYKALQVKQMMDKSMKSTIIISIIKHGTVYAFGTAVVVCANMALIHESRMRDTPFKGYLGGNLCTVFNTILACRLALSLKKDAEARRTPIAESITGFTDTRLPMGGSEGSGVPLSPGGGMTSPTKKGFTTNIGNGNYSSGWGSSGFRSIGSGTTAVNSPTGSGGKITLPAFPRGTVKKKTSFNTASSGVGGIMVKKDELETYDTGEIELDNYMPEIEEEGDDGTGSSEGHEKIGKLESRNNNNKKDNSKAVDMKRVSAIIKAMEDAREKDLEKGGDGALGGKGDDDTEFNEKKG